MWLIPVGIGLFLLLSRRGIAASSVELKPVGMKAMGISGGNLKSVIDVDFINTSNQNFTVESLALKIQDRAGKTFGVLNRTTNTLIQPRSISKAGFNVDLYLSDFAPFAIELLKSNKPVMVNLSGFMKIKGLPDSPVSEQVTIEIPAFIRTIISTIKTTGK